MEAWNQRRYEECRASLLAAWSIKPYRQIAGNLGACEIKLGLYRDAAEHLWHLTQPTPDGKRSELSQEHRRLFDEALAKVAAVNIDVEHGATVLIDGKTVGQAPLSAPVYLEPGEHSLEARTGAGATTQISVRFDAGTQRNLTLHPRMPKAAEAPSTPHDTRPAAPPPVAAAPPLAPPPPPPDTRVRDGVVIGGLALGGVALAAGVVLAVVSNGKSEEVNDATRSIAMNGDANACNDPAFRARCDALDDAYIAEGTTRNLSIAALVTAGAAIGGAALTYALWPDEAPRVAASRGVRIAPAVTAQSAGLSIGGAF
ncbi:PEGA domain-containing protein [Sorangium sp. So ce281]|uniref:PEGA domain-containing protein n=1 Tax=unclassified Sorangium TaxID=2621164 RepID=UPI003F5F8B90